MGGDKKGEGKLFGLEARANEMEVGRERIQQEEKRPREENEREKREEVVVEEKEEEAGHDGKDQDYISESDDEDDGFERMEISNERATQRRIMAAANTNTTSNNNTTPQRPPPPSKQQQHPRHPKVLPPPPSRPILTPKNPRPQQLSKVQNSTIPKPLPWLSNDPTQPLKLTPLSQIPHLPYKQNWMVNVLVIVTQLGEVEPCPYPPYVQRQARVIDQSAPDRHIHLTVFLEPETFEPRLGEVFLLMGVKNHKFDGGSLKKYVSDRPKGGGRWWVEGGKLEWCNGMVKELQSWWAQHQGGGGNVADVRVEDAR
ncbi:hypothetical protein QBC36DRAFT_322512 [Triangularia setosa]|uniref:Uncharacterized protein n=1 Tax=Triangularia setosa TaxID=2587417 RepID=A0AAN6WE41_9PEZI|nr:hypothetical protein QBC36DRAFT_322512 [Podospora setosa]